MKVLIVRTDNQTDFNGDGNALTFGLYRRYRLSNAPCHLHITANHYWSKYTFIDEKDEYIGTFDSMDKLIERKGFLGNCLIVTHEEWLNKHSPNWKK